MQRLGVPYSDADIAGSADAVKGKTEMDALVAYLQSLGTPRQVRRSMHMDLNDLRSAVTLLSLLLFLAPGGVDLAAARAGATTTRPRGCRSTARRSRPSGRRRSGR